jgi:hypothetical protein
LLNVCANLQELNHEKVASRNLLLKWNETAEELKEKGSRITELSQELADTKHISEKVTEVTTLNHYLSSLARKRL